MPAMRAEWWRLLRWGLHAVNATIVVGLSVRAALVWDRIPERVPMHFSFEGQVDRWAAKDAGFGVLFAIPWLIVGLVYAMRIALGYFARRPELANLPAQLKGLPAERVAPLFEAVSDLLLWAATAAALALGTALYGTLEVALGHAKGLEGWATPQIWLGVLVAAGGGGGGRIMVVTRRISREGT